MAIGRVLQYADHQLLLDVLRSTNGEYIKAADYDTTTSTPGTYSSPTAGSGSVPAGNVVTNVNTGFRIYAMAIHLNMFVPYGNLPSLGGGTGTYGVTIYPTYYQPNPPTTEAETLAAVTGNLALINRFWKMSLTQAFSADSTSSGTGITMTSTRQQQGVTVVFDNPITIVTSGLAMAWTSPSWDNGNSFNFMWELVGKYVPISPSQFVDLVATATGQAILPPTIFR